MFCYHKIASPILICTNMFWEWGHQPDSNFCSQANVIITKFKRLMTKETDYSGEQFLCMVLKLMEIFLKIFKLEDKVQYNKNNC